MDAMTVPAPQPVEPMPVPPQEMPPPAAPGPVAPPITDPQPPGIGEPVREPGHAPAPMG